MTATVPYWIYPASLTCAAIPAALTAWNLLLYRRPPPVPAGSEQAACSVIIPARNEASGIAACVRSVLASTGVALECLVLDDHSTDATAAICEKIAQSDPRLRVLAVPAMPAGWNGKQHACWTGAHAATKPLLLFLDADVRLAPDAIARAAQAMHASALISGIPREETGTWMEKLLLPLIHFLLLGFLPIAALRRTRLPGFAAGCGQFLLVNRDAYFASGGHQQIQSTMHDGLKLPRVLRHAGYATDIADLTTLATCRMYRNAAEVWNGLSKNATEGIAAPANILPFTLLLTMGQILPLALLLTATNGTELGLAAAACALAYANRAVNAIRFSQSWFGVLLHPLSVALLLALQWWALARKLAGAKPVWKQRAYQAG